MKKSNRKGHLTLIERDKITILKSEGLSVRKIASILDRSPSTISRELNRNNAVYFRGKYIDRYFLDNELKIVFKILILSPIIVSVTAVLTYLKLSESRKVVVLI